MTDESILDLLFARSEQGLRAMDRKYGGDCHRISRNILGSKEDAEECVNDAYLGVWNAVPPARPNPLAAFLFRILRNYCIKRHHANTAKKRDSTYDVALEELDAVLCSEESVEGHLEREELRAVIESFLDAISREDRVIFMRRYWFSDTLADIAARVGLTEKNVSVRLFRLRERLRKHLMERGISV
ncbi:MAG: sigma-70 family RNA polymerase sigma factor [Clostridia bacterium]|nr:sigma-70 family RNA polymerase sigma factor [Clostridia bacterium]